MVTYECIVVGGISTVWRGSIVHNLCQKSDHVLTLTHNRYNSSEGTHKSCSSDSILGRSVSVENNTYTSQLIVNLTPDTNYSVTRSRIECIRDDGTDETIVGSLNLTIGKSISTKHLVRSHLFCIQ